MVRMEHKNGKGDLSKNLYVQIIDQINGKDLNRMKNNKAKSDLITHTGKTFNKCNLCEYGSTNAGNLKTHLKTHSEERSNRCNYCN